MNPPLLRTMGLAAVALLLGSFPVRQVWGPVPCDIMRLGGFLLVLLLAVRAWIAWRGKPGHPGFYLYWRVPAAKRG